MRVLVFVVALLTGAAGCASSRVGVTEGASPASLAEAELVARVKTALLNDTIVGLRRIDVHAAGAHVRLSGRVASAAERDRAVQLARGVAGVRGVTSELDIRP